MQLGEALERIDAIRLSVARVDLFRGFKAATVAGTGFLAFGAAAMQSLIVPNPLESLQRYLQLWIGVAAVSFLGVATELVVRWVKTDSSLQREQTLRAAQHFLPCLVAGAAMTWAIVQFSPSAASLLPGLWAIVFSLGISASCRQLPPAATIIAVYYLASGVACLVLARGVYSLSPWAMVGTFGIGQLLTAAVLYLALERRHGEC